MGDKRRINVTDCWPVNAVKEVMLFDLVNREPLILSANQPKVAIKVNFVI